MIYDHYLSWEIKIENWFCLYVKVDVAEAKMKGEIGAKLRQGQTAQNAAKIDAETKIISTKRDGESKKEEVKVKSEVKIFENQKDADVAKAVAELAAQKAGWSKAAHLAEVEAKQEVSIREAELQVEVEKKNALTRTEKLRADLLSKATVEYDIKVIISNQFSLIFVDYIVERSVFPT